MVQTLKSIFPVLWMCTLIHLSIDCFLKLDFFHQMVLKLAPSSRDQIGPGNPEGEEEPDQVVDDLDPTEEGEASEEAHSASNEPQLGLRCHLRFCMNPKVRQDFWFSP